MTGVCLYVLVSSRVPVKEMWNIKWDLMQPSKCIGTDVMSKRENVHGTMVGWVVSAV